MLVGRALRPAKHRIETSGIGRRSVLFFSSVVVFAAFAAFAAVANNRIRAAETQRLIDAGLLVTVTVAI